MVLKRIKRVRVWSETTAQQKAVKEDDATMDRIPDLRMHEVTAVADESAAREQVSPV